MPKRKGQPKAKPKPKKAKVQPQRAARDFQGIDLDNLHAPADVPPFYSRPGRLDIRTYMRRILAAPSKFYGFLFSNPYVEDDNNNEQWVPLKVLGAGGNGNVVAYVKKNSMGEVIDSLAIKQHPAGGEFSAWVGSNEMSNEAFFQSQLNSADQDDVFVKLRRYKYYSFGPHCRLYMELAANGDLWTLRERYRAFDKYIPELWLWHIFETLALACITMEQCPKNWEPMFESDEDQPGPTKYILHCDIKPENIFIFDTTYHKVPKVRNTDFKTYDLNFPALPKIKLGDFGLTEVTFPGDYENPENLVAGTYGYIPPEVPEQPNDQRGGFPAGRFDDTWTRPIYERAEQMEPRYNLFGIGKVMHDLVTMCPFYYVFHEFRGVLEHEYYDEDHPLYNHFIPFIGHPVRQGGTTYSTALRQTIREAIRLDAQNRPNAEDLLETIREGKQSCIAYLRRQAKDANDSAPLDEQQVVAKAHEFNDVPFTADANFPAGTPQDQVLLGMWQDLRGKTDIFDEARLEPPRPKFKAFWEWEEQNGGFLQPIGDHFGHIYKQAGDLMKMEQDIIDVRENHGSDSSESPPPAPLPRRVLLRDWDENQEQDNHRRQRLTELRDRVLGLCGDKTFDLVDYVLTKSHMSVGEAERVLNWMFANGELPTTWEWAADRDIIKRARRIRDHLTRDGLNVSERECQYFIATTDYSVDQVWEAERMLWYTYKARHERRPWAVNKE
jgi:serine/threonine protein kinase